MKNKCPHCGKSVTVPDDRQGEVVACPQCHRKFQAPIMLRPLDDEPPVAQTEVIVEAEVVAAEATGDNDDAGAIWYLPGHGDQNAGPFTQDEIVAKLRKGQIVPATPCWREGMDNWVPLAHTGEFAGVIGSRKPVPPAKQAPPPTPDKRQRIIVAGSVAVILISLAATVWVFWGSFGTESSVKFRSKSSLAKIAAELQQPAPAGAVPGKSSGGESASYRPSASAVADRSPGTGTEMVIRREDFHLDVGTKETWRFQPTGSAAGVAEYVLVEKLPSSTAAVFRQTVKFNGNNLPDMLVSVSEDAISARAPDQPQTQLLLHWQLPLRAGQTYEYTSPAGRITARIEGPEEVTVPAGTFRCLVCVEQVHAQDQQWENRVWLAPTTGAVKLSYGGPNGFESRLIKKEQATSARDELVICREDFKFDVGYKDIFEHIPQNSAAARINTEFTILSKTQSGNTTLFQRIAKGADGKTEEQLLTLSQEGLSLYPTTTQTGLPLAHFPLPQRVGQTFEVTVLGGRVKARVEGVEEVRVPAGTYRCLLLVEHVETQDRLVEVRVWMAPKVGTVKWSVDGPDGFTENLVSQQFINPASLAKKPIPFGSGSAPRGSRRGSLRSGIELLAANDLLGGRVAGKWTHNDDGLTVLPEKGLLFLQLNLPGEIVGSYDMEVQFTRHTSDQAVGVVLPAGSRLCSVVLSSYAGIASGLEYINDQDVRNNPTTVKPATLNNGQPYTLLIHVRPQGDMVSITATLDGKPFISWSGAQSSLHSYQGSWEAVPNRASLIAYECSVTFHSVRLRRMAR